MCFGQVVRSEIFMNAMENGIQLIFGFVDERNRVFETLSLTIMTHGHR
nr:hypothetical protein [Zymomonas mobilis]